MIFRSTNREVRTGGTNRDLIRHGSKWGVASLRDGQDDGMAGSAARATEIARGSARSVHRNVGCSRSGDQVGRDCGLQLLSAGDRGAECRPVDDHDGRGNKVTAIECEQKPLLGLGERNCCGG